MNLRMITTNRGAAPTASDIAEHLAKRQSLERDLLQILAEKYDYEPHRRCVLCGDTGVAVSYVDGVYVAQDCQLCNRPPKVEDAVELAEVGEEGRAA